MTVVPEEADATWMPATPNVSEPRTEPITLRVIVAPVHSLPVVMSKVVNVRPREMPYAYDVKLPDRFEMLFSLIVMPFSKPTRMPFATWFGDAVLIRFCVITFVWFLRTDEAPCE